MFTPEYHDIIKQVCLQARTLLQEQLHTVIELRKETRLLGRDFESIPLPPMSRIKRFEKAYEDPGLLHHHLGPDIEFFIHVYVNTTLTFTNRIKSSLLSKLLTIQSCNMVYSLN